MILGKVVGTVVSSTNSINISGGSYLLINKCNQKGQVRNDFIVALDILGTAIDEMVMISESTSARETTATQNKSIDAVIVGVIDMIDENEKLLYKK